MSINSSLKGKDLLCISDFTADELRSVLSLAHELKKKQKAGKEHKLLAGKTLAMIFEKPSNRTRVSFEVGMFQLGGFALNISGVEVGMGKRESIADVARTTSRFVDGVMIRSLHHWLLEEFSKAATVPLINGLSDHHHPCQALADILTVEEHFGNLNGINLCYVGDGNNVCNSLIEICERLGLTLTVSSPQGYEPLLRDPNHPQIKFVRDPKEAVKGAHVVYTDVWISMGQEELTGRKLQEFLDYKITADLMNHAEKNAVFMHCLPAHRGFEVDAEVFEGPQSIVFDQAENRLHAQKALMALVI
jgi:ornithine carbamoyltransferase